VKHIFEFVKNVKKTGAIAPSSKFLVKDLVGYLKTYRKDWPGKSIRVLELGPGTGVLTKEILRCIRPQDHFDSVELNRYFYCHLLKKYRHENLNIYKQDFLEFESGESYDFIFSSLPYESMPEDLASDIWQKKLELCRPNAYICYYKYVKIGNFRCDFEKELVEKYQQDKTLVMLNLPPARCFTLRLNGQAKEPVLIS